MARHLVTMLVGVVVEADTPEDAQNRASLPFRNGVLPSVVALAHAGTRLATADDEADGIQKRVVQMATASQMG